MAPVGKKTIQMQVANTVTTTREKKVSRTAKQNGINRKIRNVREQNAPNKRAESKFNIDTFIDI